MDVIEDCGVLKSLEVTSLLLAGRAGLKRRGKRGGRMKAFRCT